MSTIRLITVIRYLPTTIGYFFFLHIIIFNVQLGTHLFIYFYLFFFHSATIHYTCLASLLKTRAKLFTGHADVFEYVRGGTRIRSLARSESCQRSRVTRRRRAEAACIVPVSYTAAAAMLDYYYIGYIINQLSFCA